MIDPRAALRQGLLGLSQQEAVRRTIEHAPLSRSVIRRFVAGEDTASGVQAAADLVDSGRLATVAFLGEQTVDASQASRTRDAYLELLRALRERELTADGAVEVSLVLGAVGQALPEDGAKVALDNARQICEAAGRAGTTVTIDMEDHTVTDSTLAIVRDLRADFPWVGAVLQAQLRRTEADCRDLVGSGSRVRLVKGSHAEPESVAFTDKHEVDLSYVRCLKVLLEGSGYPMIATHDPKLIEIGRSLADKQLRSPSSFEFQMLYGARPDEQRRLADAGFRTRVYVPYGDDWYPYLMHRLAERPANTRFLLRSAATKG